ncbi:MAG: DUF3857 domain-containing protein [Rubrivivax sp.]|nr:DUF3857 domain-containing protein [Pyrinomonadaceae bacterium]
MNSPRPFSRRGALPAFCLFVALVFAAASPAFAGDKDWKPIDPAQLALTAPVVEKEADAEVLFWEVRVSYEDSGGDPGTILNHYVRIKIFNERGRESQSKIDILAPKFRGREFKIKDIAARTIKPDGTIVELKKEDVFERDVVKTSGVKIKAKSFAMPSVEAGSIIEYRWREVRDGISGYDRFEFSRDIPAQFVKYWIKPYREGLVNSEGRPVGLRAQTFQTGNATPFVKEKDGSYSIALTKVSAFREEPRMPPEYSIRPWMLVFYAADTPTNPDLFWRDHGRKMGAALKSLLKANDEVRKTATEVVGDAQTPDQKLGRLFDFVRTKVRRYTDDALGGMTAEEKKKVKENKSPADTLKRGVGTGADVDLLFGALASAAGFDVRVALTSDREDYFFDRGFPDDYFINPASIAVKVGDGWRLFNPGSTYIAFGMLRWQEEGQLTLIADEKEPTWIMSPISSPDKSLEKHTGKFKLSEDGTLEGDVKIEYTGHRAADFKEYNDDESPDAREELLKDKFKGRMAGAEITNIKVENVTDPVKPFTYTFHVRVPGYAQRTGKRLFVQPAFFQHGTGPMFPTSGRNYDVYFHYPWAEEDLVEIELPEGFALDNPEAPAPMSAGEISQYQPTAQITTDGRLLIYKRKFYFGANRQTGGSSLLFPPTTYATLKAYFDGISKLDGHTMALKQGATTAASGTTPE